MHHHHTHHMANQAQVPITVHRTDKVGDLVSGLALERELLRAPLRDTWLVTEQAAHEVVLPDRTVEVGEAAQVQALLHHHLRGTRALALAAAAADRFTLRGLVATYPFQHCYLIIHYLNWITGKYLGPAKPVAMTVCMSMFLLTYGVCNFSKICVPDLVERLAMHNGNVKMEARTLEDQT
jgi:hypothetical protein